MTGYRGKRVIIMSDVPSIQTSPESCFRQAVLGRDSQPHCTIDQAVVAREMSGAKDFYARLSKEACVFDLTSHFMKGTDAFMVKDGQVLYYDLHHLNPAGSAYAAAAFARSNCFAGG